MLQAAVMRRRLPWRSWWDGPAPGPIARLYKVQTWPMTFVLDHQGIIRHFNLRGPELEQAVERLVQQAERGKRA